MKYCQQINLPAVPDKFLLTEDQILRLELLSPDAWWQEGYGSFLANQEVHDFLQPFFPKSISVRYQLITKDIPFHTDGCKHPFKYNYVYKTGGQKVKTIWKSKDLFIVDCEPNTWYKLNIKVPHMVKDVETARCTITVKEDI